METLPILNTPLPQSVERAEKDQTGPETDEAAASLGFGGMLQQAYAATVPSVTSTGDQVQHQPQDSTQTSENVSEVKVSKAGETRATFPGPVVPASLEALPTFEQLTRTSLPFQVAAPEVTTAQAPQDVATPDLAQILDGIFPSNSEGIATPTEDAGTSPGPTSGKEVANPTELNGQRQMAAALAELSNSLDATIPELTLPDASTPLREVTVASILRRQTTNSSPVKSSVESQTSLNLTVASILRRQTTNPSTSKSTVEAQTSLNPLVTAAEDSTQDATSGTSVRRQQAGTFSPTTSFVGRMTVASMASAATLADTEGVSITAATDGTEAQAAEVAEGAKTVPLRMLLQRQVGIPSPEVGGRDLRSRNTNSGNASLRADDRQSSEQASEPVVTTGTIRLTDRHQEAQPVAHTSTTATPAKSGGDADTTPARESAVKGEQQVDTAKSEAVAVEHEGTKASPMFESRSANVTRSVNPNAGSSVPVVNGDTATAREATQMSAANRTLFDSAGSLLPEQKASVVGQVVKEIALQVHGQVSEMRMRLEPDTLGEVVLKVRMENGNMNAQIDVQQSSVKAVLDSSLPQLRQVLAEHGIDVQRLDVSCNGDSSSRESGRGEGERKKGYGHRRGEGMDAIEQYQTGRLLGYNTLEVVM
jgi:flagellar hook-length control protein FliK